MHFLPTLQKRFYMFSHTMMTGTSLAFYGQHNLENQTVSFKHIALQLYHLAPVVLHVAAVLNLHLNKTPSPNADDRKENIYADNILSGSDTEDGIVQYYTQARTIMSKAKFNLIEIMVL